MNERLKELVEECGLYIDPYSKEVTDKEIEYFAETIVRECAGVVEDSVWHLPRGYKAKDQAEFVRKHFGVKE